MCAGHQLPPLACVCVCVCRSPSLLCPPGHHFASSSSICAVLPFLSFFSSSHPGGLWLRNRPIKHRQVVSAWRESCRIKDAQIDDLGSQLSKASAEVDAARAEAGQLSAELHAARAEV
jgi:hypothetical protein